MGNAIDKAFMVLEKIASTKLPALPPAQIADELKLNRATCSRILKQLLEMGYVIQVSRRQGYTAGPKLHTMGMICGFGSPLLKYAAPVIDRCAMELQSSVLLSQLYNGRRYIIYHRNCNPDIQINVGRPCYDDIFVTATGLLLAAYSSSSERKHCYEVQKKYGGVFPDEFSGFEALNCELDKIRQQKYVEMSRGSLWIYAYPVKYNGHFNTAIGMNMLKNQHTAGMHEKICRTLKAAAQELSNYSEMKLIIG